MFRYCWAVFAEKTHILSKYRYLSLSIGCHLLGVQFVTSLESNLCTSLTEQTTTDNSSNIINSASHNTTALQCNVFLAGRNWLQHDLMLVGGGGDYRLQSYTSE